jgi:hypothetical protein
LRAVDLGRQKGLFPDVEVKQELGVWKQSGQAIESAQRLIGTVKMLVQSDQVHGRLGGRLGGIKDFTGSPVTVFVT